VAVKYFTLIPLIGSFFLASQVFAESASGCSAKEIVKLRASFQQEYNNKNYEEAYQILEPVTQCEMNPQEMLWIKNDLMLTKVKLKDYSGACLTFRSDIDAAINKVTTSDQLKKAFNNVSASCEGDYFGILNTINKIPEGAKEIDKCDKNEKEKFLALLKKTMTENEFIDDFGYDSTITVYKGDFSNQGRVDYVVVSEQGSGHYDTLYIYHLEGDKLISVNSDYKRFEAFRGDSNAADPFAFVKNNKVYIRFMNYPKDGHFDYDPSQLYTCTYLMEGSKVTLIGPDYIGTWPEYKVIPFDGCPK
jgi:hypothetical protein